VFGVLGGTFGGVQRKKKTNKEKNETGLEKEGLKKRTFVPLLGGVTILRLNKKWGGTTKKGGDPLVVTWGNKTRLTE